MLLLDQFDRSVVITVAVVGVMQVAVDQVADVIAVGYRFVAAAGAVDVIGGMAAADVAGRAAVGVLGRNFDGVMLDGAALLLMVKMAVVQIIDMVAVLDGGVAAAFTVIMIVMVAMMTHDWTPPVYSWGWICDFGKMFLPHPRTGPHADH